MFKNIYTQGKKNWQNLTKHGIMSQGAIGDDLCYFVNLRLYFSVFSTFSVMNNNCYYNWKMRSNEFLKNYHSDYLRQVNQPLCTSFFTYKIGIKAPPP